MYSMKLKSSYLLLLNFQIILLNELSANSVRGSQYQRISPQEKFYPPPPGYLAFPEFGKAYHVVMKHKLTWSGARDYCVSNNASLAIPDTAKKVDRIIQVDARCRIIHVGLYYSIALGVWVTVGKNTEAMLFLPWAANYPEYNKGYCAGIDGGRPNPGAVRRGKLINYECGLKRAFVCEVPLVNEA